MLYSNSIFNRKAQLCANLPEHSLSPSACDDRNGPDAHLARLYLYIFQAHMFPGCREFLQWLFICVINNESCQIPLTRRSHKRLSNNDSACLSINVASGLVPFSKRDLNVRSDLLQLLSILQMLHSHVRLLSD